MNEDDARGIYAGTLQFCYFKYFMYSYMLVRVDLHENINLNNQKYFQHYGFLILRINIFWFFYSFRIEKR